MNLSNTYWYHSAILYHFILEQKRQTRRLTGIAPDEVIDMLSLAVESGWFS